ncbi:Protein of unknown function DUF616 [Dillenia turbinata]|uniref:TOD1/MUCI70 glycosyltransferase-like domain-containing protein n=1 Tax=Dillenia turbinata TaxID=194707 RepID=A0AAN8VBT5_9MAGN
MALLRYNNELVPERRGILGAIFKTPTQYEHGTRGIRRVRRFSRVTKRFSLWVLVLSMLLFTSLALMGIKLHFHGGTAGEISSIAEGESEVLRSDVLQGPIRKRRRRQHFPCKVGFLESVDDFVEPKDIRNFTQFSIGYVGREDLPSGNDQFEPKFGGHQTLEEREKTFYARNQTLHCGFVKGPVEFRSTGFDLDEKDTAYMNTCRVVVSSCIFGSSDFLRRPTKKLGSSINSIGCLKNLSVINDHYLSPVGISDYSQKNVCFVMFVDEETLTKLSAEGNAPDDAGYVGLWKIVIVRNLPYKDMRRTGKVPKFLSHRLFPSSRYSIWLDSKMRLQTDPMLIIEYFLWRTKSEYAISNHYDRHCIWEEVLQNKRLNKYNHTAIDEQFNFYQSDGLTKFDPSDPNNLLPSYVPEGSFIVRAHTPMSNLFSCLWFNEVDRFTSRDQLSFAYTYLKLRRLNPDKPFYLNMFKDCERRALAKLFRHREEPAAPHRP